MEFLFSCSTWYLTCRLTCGDIAMNTRSKIPNLRLPMHQLLLRDLNILFLFICGFLRFRPGSVFQRPKAWELLIIHVQGYVIINSAFELVFTLQKCGCFCLVKNAKFPLFEILHEVLFEVFKSDFLEHLSHQKSRKSNVILLYIKHP